jgi:hypothetical protein
MLTSSMSGAAAQLTPHMGDIDARPAQYERRVVGFFDDALR